MAQTTVATRIVPPALSERWASRRTLDERIRVRFPAPFQAIGAFVYRLSPRSRLRRWAIGLQIARVYGAANRRDFDLVLAFNDPALYEFHPSVDLLPPDMDRVYRGHDGYREFWRLWLEAFEDIRWDPEEILDFGDKALVTTQQSAHGLGSGVAVSEPVFQLFTMRRGMVVRQEDFLNRARALAAAGVRE
jgi:ketosteroid isomerase-like protein